MKQITIRTDGASGYVVELIEDDFVSQRLACKDVRVAKDIAERWSHTNGNCRINDYTDSRNET